MDVCVIQYASQAPAEDGNCQEEQDDWSTSVLVCKPCCKNHKHTGNDIYRNRVQLRTCHVRIAQSLYDTW